MYLEVIFIVYQHENISKNKEILLVLPDSNLFSVLIPKTPRYCADCIPVELEIWTQNGGRIPLLFSKLNHILFHHVFQFVNL